MVKLLATVSLLLLACSGSPSGADFDEPSYNEVPSEGLPSTPAPATSPAVAGQPPTMPVVGVSGSGGASGGPAEQTAPQGQAGGGAGGSLAGTGGSAAGADVGGQAPVAIAGAGGNPNQRPIPDGARLVDDEPLTWTVAPNSCWRFDAEDPNATITMQVGTEPTPVGCIPTGLGMVMNPTSKSYVVTGLAKANTWISAESQPYASCSLACPTKAAP